MSTRPTLDQIVEVLGDKRRYIPTLLRIVNKEQVEVPFELNPIQLDKLETRTGRDIYLKPRQVGSTSIDMADFLIDTISNPGTVTVVIAHEEFITQRLLTKAQYFYDTLCKTLPIYGLPLPPPIDHKSSYEKTWPSIGSTFYIGSARQFVFGVGDRIDNLLCSEVSRWPDPTRIIIPALQAVPINGRVILESTANGQNYYTTMYGAARVGKSPFTAHFYPWWMCPDYRLTYDDPLAPDHSPCLELTDEEQRLVDNHHLTHDQIRWRRYKINEFEVQSEDEGTRQLFQQEYPEDEQSAFVASGDMLYNADLIKYHTSRCCKPPFTYMNAQVWRKPEAGIRYLVSIDPGQGRQTRTAIEVWHYLLQDGKEVSIHDATWAGFYTATPTAEKAVELAKWYNKALITWEANGHGLAIASEQVIKRWPRKYYRKDIIRGRTSQEQGWLTTTRTKPTMIKEIRRLLPTMEVNDINIITEFGNLREIDGQVVAIGYDDLHDAAAIAAVCRDSATIMRKGFTGHAGYPW